MGVACVCEADLRVFAVVHQVLCQLSRLHACKCRSAVVVVA